MRLASSRPWTKGTLPSSRTCVTRVGQRTSDAVSRKLAATQELQRKDTEIEIERKERTKREVQAQGIANAMQIIRGQLSGMYIQHEAIEAQKAMVNSPNHTVVYIPVGPMGVPITGTFPTAPTTEAVATR